MAMLVWEVGRLWRARLGYRLRMACGWVAVMQQLGVFAFFDEIREAVYKYITCRTMALPGSEKRGVRFDVDLRQ